MLTNFICLDKNKIPIRECLLKCRRPEGRCLSLPTLMEIANIRPWEGRPSTTQLINGTRLEYLKITRPYSINPFERAFALLGTRHHGRLAAIAQKLNALSEEKLQGEVSGIFDLLVPDSTSDTEAYELWDYKTSGSYKIAQALGLVAQKVPDPSGAVYEKSGKWGHAGDPKIVTVYKPNPGLADMWEWEMQLNNYRIMVEDCGFHVSKMFIQATVRDGGTMIAENRGITQNIYLLPVKRLIDRDVQSYFIHKKVNLLFAIDTNTLPPLCNEREAWGYRRCTPEFCDVFECCKKEE